MLLKILQNSQENTLVRVSFFLRPATLLKRRLWHRCFPRNFAKFLRAPPTDHLRWLLLFLKMPNKYCMWMNSNFTGNQSWNKSKHFHLFLILMLKKSGFFNVKFFLWIIFKNTFVTEPLQWLLLYLRWLLLYFFKKLIEQLFRNLVMTLWRYDIVTLWRYDIFFFSTHYLMYKKSNSFVYKFVVSCQVFETTPSGCTL